MRFPLAGLHPIQIQGSAAFLYVRVFPIHRVLFRQVVPLVVMSPPCNTGYPLGVGLNSDRSKRHEYDDSIQLDKVLRSGHLETDRSRLAARIQAAEAAIKVRAQELNSHHEGTEEKRIAINDALSGLRILRQELNGVISEAGSATSQRFNCTSSQNTQDA